MFYKCFIYEKEVWIKVNVIKMQTEICEQSRNFC